MRILNVVLDARGGGPLARITRVARPLSALGIETVVGLPDDDETPDAAALRGLETIRLPLSRLRRQRLAASAVRTLGRLTGEVDAIRSALLSARIDAVHCNGILCLQALRAARAAGVPAVWHLNDMLVPSPIVRGLLAFHRRCARAVIASSRAVARHAGLRPTEHAVLYPPVDTEHFDPRRVDARAVEALRRELGVPYGATPVLAVGNIHPQKGFADFIRAVHALRRGGLHAIGLIAGRILGSQERHHSELCALLRELDPEPCVRFLGPREDMRELMALAEAVAVPSHSEALGMVALEAAAMCRPVVATRVGGIPEAVRDGETGVLVPPGSPEAMAAALAGLLRDSARRSAMGEAGRRWVQDRFDLRACADRHAALYRRLISTR